MENSSNPLSQPTLIQPPKKKNHLQHLRNGLISGSCIVAFTQPLQVIRTSMVIHYVEGTKPAGLVYIINRIFREEGIKGFFRSVVPSLYKTTLNVGLYFYGLEIAKTHLGNLNFFGPNSLNFTASALSRTFSCILLNPLVIISTRIQVLGFNEYKSVFKALKRIGQEEGYKGYAKGLNCSLAKDVPASAIFYPIYEILKKLLNQIGITNIQLQATLGATIANGMVTVLNNPLDVIRTRLQYQYISKKETHNYSSIIRGTMQIFREEGSRGLLLGVIPRIIKRTIGTSIAWTCYETLKQWDEKKLELRNNN